MFISVQRSWYLRRSRVWSIKIKRLGHFITFYFDWWIFKSLFGGINSFPKSNRRFTFLSIFLYNWRSSLLSQLRYQSFSFQQIFNIVLLRLSSANYRTWYHWIIWCTINSTVIIKFLLQALIKPNRLLLIISCIIYTLVHSSLWSLEHNPLFSNINAALYIYSTLYWIRRIIWLLLLCWRTLLDLVVSKVLCLLPSLEKYL